MASISVHTCAKATVKVSNGQLFYSNLSCILFFTKSGLIYVLMAFFLGPTFFGRFYLKCEKKSRKRDSFARLSRTFDVKFLRLQRLTSFLGVRTTT